MKPRQDERDEQCGGAERGEGRGFWGKRNERKKKRRLTGDIDRSDRRATFGKNAPPDRRPDIFRCSPTNCVSRELRPSSYRIATF